jgi:hypothetical protein
MLLALSIVSCKSAPGAAPADPNTRGGAEKTAPGNAGQWEAAKTDAAAQRKLAQDFKGAEYFPSDYQQAESQYAEAEALRPSDPGGYQEGAKQYTAAADAYRQLNEKNLPRYFEEEAKTAQSAREQAVQAGAEKTKGEALQAADAAAQEGGRRYGEKDYYAAAGSYNAAREYYSLAERMAAGAKLRGDITSRKLMQYDGKSYAQGEENTAAADAAYQRQDIPAAQSAAEAALANYQAVIDASWKGLAEERAKAAKAEQAKALEAKAQIALKSDYAAAEAVLAQGDGAMKKREYQQAHAQYSQAETLFAAAGRNAAQKRRNAENSIKQADKKVVESGQLARTVQRELAGTRVVK